MAVFTVFVNVAGKRIAVGNVAFEHDPDPNQFESVELVELDAEPVEDAISVTFTPA